MDTDVNVKRTDKHHRSIDVAACCGGCVDTARLLVYIGADVKRVSIANYKAIIVLQDRQELSLYCYIDMMRARLSIEV